MGHRGVACRRRGVHAAEHMEEGLLVWGFTMLEMLEPLADPALGGIEKGQFGRGNLHREGRNTL